MLYQIPEVIDQQELAHIREQLAQVNWSDGRGSAGYLSGAVKNNEQLPDDHPLGRQLSELILRKLDQNPLFTSAALPKKILPPLFNRYCSAQTYGPHVDGAVRPLAGTPLRVRTDLSATLFLTEPEDYEGGELCIEDTFGERPVKLKAGDMVLYPGSSIHQVTPVTRGERLAAFFWIESMVRQDSRRGILFELDQNIQSLARRDANQPELVRLAGVYHNLLREWSDT